MKRVFNRTAVRLLLAITIGAMAAWAIIPVASGIDSASAEIQKKKKKKDAKRNRPGPSANSATGSNSSALTSDEIDGMVAGHNKLRSQHGVPGLQWSDELAGYAQVWADRLSRNGCVMEHRPDEGEFKQLYGENIAFTIQGNSIVDQAIGMWEKERAKYQGQPLTMENFGEVGHYTQIMWSKTTRVGCGKSNCKSFTIVVCNYDPAGNFLGQSAW